MCLNKGKNNESVVNWISIISSTIGSDYFLVTQKALVGLLLVIFAKKSLKTNIREVISSEKKLGFNNSFGNKGAIAVRMDIDNTKF